MAREKGTFLVSANYEPQKAAPFDARALVETKADLFAANTWAINNELWIYKGMIVAVATDIEPKNNGIYMLLDDVNYFNEDAWLKMSDSTMDGESAGEVLGQLNSYKETNDAVVAAINGKIGTPGEGQNDEGDTLYSLIAEAQTQANKGVADAKTANDAIAALTNGAIATNTSDISAIKGRLTTLETEVLPIINKHSDILAGIGGDGEKATVKAYVDDAIAAIPTYELPAATAETLGGVKSAADVDGKAVTNAVYVDATSNVGSVKTISTDILVQGVEELILNGGSAKA